MKYIRKHITLLGILLYMFVTLSFVSGKMNNVLCENVDVIIEDSAKYQFTKPGEVVSLLKTMELRLWGYPIYDIASHRVEDVILDNMSMVKNVCVWSNIHGELNVRLSQRKPIARVVTKTGDSYYLSDKGHAFPLSPNFTSRVPVISGDIYQKLTGTQPVTIDSLVRLAGVNNTMLDEVYRIATYIYNDSLMKRQIEQIHVTKNEFELVPKVGTHIITFGTVDDMVDKFFKLKVIYYKGFSNLGWNKYSRVNLKFKNQVVCTKR